jgi:hypothetical protein
MLTDSGGESLPDDLPRPDALLDEVAGVLDIG